IKPGRYAINTPIAALGRLQIQDDGHGEHGVELLEWHEDGAGRSGTSGRHQRYFAQGGLVTPEELKAWLECELCADGDGERGDKSEADVVGVLQVEVGNEPTGKLGGRTHLTPEVVRC